MPYTHKPVALAPRLFSLGNEVLTGNSQCCLPPEPFRLKSAVPSGLPKLLQNMAKKPRPVLVLESRHALSFGPDTWRGQSTQVCIAQAMQRRCMWRFYAYSLIFQVLINMFLHFPGTHSYVQPTVAHVPQVGWHDSVTSSAPAPALTNLLCLIFLSIHSW